MKMGLRKICMAALGFLLAASFNAQSPVSAQVSSKKVQVGVPFEYAIVITIGANNYSPPNFKDFEVVSGPNQSTSTQWANGVLSNQTTLSWGLVSRKEGKYTIGPAIVNAANQKYETNPISIEVTKGPASSSGQGSAESGKTGDIDKEIFLRAIPTKTKIYVGEQLTVSYKIFSTQTIIGMKKFDSPAFEGFWAKRIELPSTSGQQENIDGVVYITAEVDKHLLYANSPGKKIIKPIEPHYVIRRLTVNKKPRNIFEQFFGGQQYEDVEVAVKCNPLTIEVLPLPEEKKPENFNGAVGKLNWNVEASKTTLKANDAFNLKITISGSGNFPLISAPKLELPESFETYDPKVSENSNSKIFDYLIIPREEGEFTMKDLDFSYFNLEQKKYVTLPSPLIKISVLPADAGSSSAQVYTSQNKIKESENDIRYIKKGNFELLKSETEFFNSPAHIGILITALLSLVAALIARNNYIKMQSNVALVKERKAARVAKKQLVLAEKLMQQNKKDDFYTEVLTAINNYLSNKLNIPVADLSREKVQSKLISKQVGPQQIVKVLSTIETAEYAKYAPGAVSADLQTVYKDTIELITALEEELNKKT
jgi:hypothetical protein